MRCVSAPSDVTEAATRRELIRRALPTEADELQVRAAQLQNAFHRLTPELSRPVAGRRMRASVAQSTQPTPRHGVGLNELLCDHPKPGEAAMSPGFIGAGIREPVNAVWGENGLRP